MSRKKVLMSASAVAVVASAFVATEDVSAATHKVSSGDTLYQISQANNVSVSDLKKWNNLQHDLIFPNQVIQVMKPTGGSSNNSSSSSSSSSDSSSSSSAGETYTVKSGDTLSAIAFANKVSVKTLMSWNNLNSTLIHPGNKLSLKNGGSSSSSSSNSNSSSDSNNSSSSNSTYVVKSGDTLSQIASSHGTSASKIADLNGMKLSDIIHVGDKLTVSGTASNNSSSDSSSSSNSNSGSSSTNSTYVVKSGDSLSKIASAHGTTAQKIASLSGIKVSSIIHIGDKLTVSGKANTNAGSNNSSNAGSNNNSKPPVNSGFSANQLMNSANSVVGTKYVWGGTTQSGGFDCSGFIHWAYNDAGKSMARTSTDGYYSRSFEISRSELQVGDLVFFSGTYRPGISHMGIYAGSNNFIHAGTSTGVTVTSLDNSYWSKHFDSYKRFY